MAVKTITHIEAENASSWAPGSEQKSGFAQALIAWFLENGRDLPWRKTQDPYHIWLSEVMLQQTQVKTVIDYYHRFLSLFPTVQDLANAPADKVMKAWEGLGYYARCRNLHQSAKIIANDHQGVFPDTLEAVEALPGIGRSTAGAILTFSYDQAHPLLDGNVKRVLSRLYDIDANIDGLPLQKQLWLYSETLLKDAVEIDKGSWTFNQAIMELGATICLPKEPRCLICPVKPQCLSAERGTQLERPVKIKKAPTPHHHIAVGVIWDAEKKRVFIQQRPEQGLLGGLWEFPGGKQEAGETLEETVQREIQEELGLKVTVGSKITMVKHAYTHFKITLHAYHCELLSTQPPTLTAAIDSQWVPLADLERFAFPKANKLVLKELLEALGDN
ncbi:MAG: A/G-specific adenine glycosylase [Vampirovibrionales bacterium]|nr:A/G-specific adenine glycosylase [Vampirovibrionales bacterium]